MFAILAAYWAMTDLSYLLSERLWAGLMLLYLPISVIWEFLIPWGKGRSNIPVVLFLWVPLLGTIVYSGVAYVIANGRKKN